LTEEQRLDLLQISASLRNILKFEYASGGTGDGVEERGLGCRNGIKWKCLIEEGVRLHVAVAAYTMVIALKLKAVGAALFVTAGTAAVPLAMSTKFFIAAYVGLITLSVDKYWKAVRSDECKCDNGPQFSCNIPAGVRVTGLIPCQSTQTLEMFDFGTYSGMFQWALDQTTGIAIDYPSGTSEPITSVPRLRVRQLDVNVPVRISIRLVSYADPLTMIYTLIPPMNLVNISNSTGTVSVWGPTTILSGRTGNYRIVGTSVTNFGSTNTFSMGAFGAGAVIQSNAGKSISVKWNNVGSGTVRATALSTCTAQSTDATLGVKVVEE